MRQRLRRGDESKLPLTPGEHYHAVHTVDPSQAAVTYGHIESVVELVSKWGLAAELCGFAVESHDDGLRVQAGPHLVDLYVEACTDSTCSPPVEGCDRSAECSHRKEAP